MWRVSVVRRQRCVPDGRRPTDPRARMCYAPALPRHRRGVRRSACFRVRGGVCLEDRRWRCGPGWGWGPTGVERRVSDETRVGSAEAAVKGSGGLSVLSRETAWGAPHRRERWPVPAAAVRAAVDADGCQRFETFHCSCFSFLHSKPNNHRNMALRRIPEPDPRGPRPRRCQ